MKKILLTFSILIFFGIFSEVFASNDIVRYSEYKEDWTLDKQLFNLGDKLLPLNCSSDDPNDENCYKIKTFKVAALSGSICGDDEVGSDVAEYGENFEGLGRLEVGGNNNNEVTFWKFKPGKAFGSLENEDFVEFCYGEGTGDLDSKIKIKKTGNQLTLKTVGNGDQQKVVIAKKIGDNGVEIEVSLRCEPDDIAFNSVNTGEEEEKFIISLRRLDLKTDNSEFKVKIEGDDINTSEGIDIVDTFFTIKGDNINANFYYDPTNKEVGDFGSNNGTGKLVYNNKKKTSMYIFEHPDLLEMTLYKGKIEKIKDIFDVKNHPIIAKGNGIYLSTNISPVILGETEQYSLITHIKGSTAQPTIKVYSVLKNGAKIISSDVFPAIAKSGSKIHFDIIANIYNSLSDLDYAQIVFDDERFEKFNLKLGKQLSGSGETASKELTFSGDYTLPSDNSIDGQFIGYMVYVILKDGTRTELRGKKEIYVGTRDDICKDQKMCVLRGLKALKSKIKTAFDKVLIKNFDKSESNFTENDLYKIFRKGN